MDERTSPLRKEIEEWQSKASALEASATKIREEIAAMAPEAAGREAARERAKLLAVATAEARRNRLEAENRFAGARDDWPGCRKVRSGRPSRRISINAISRRSGGNCNANSGRCRSCMVRSTPALSA
jgi:hypothetical protein